METAKTQYKPLRGRGAFVIEGLAADNTVFHAIRDTQLWEPHVIAAIEKVVKPDFVCLDVGANIGAITLPLARLASKGMVYAFEASPTAAELLSRNVQNNGFENVRVANLAITERTGDTVEMFSTGAELGCAHMTSSELGRSGNREQVRTEAIDDMVDINPVDFIKMDVEGGEIKALEGASRLIEARHPILVIEYNPVPAGWFAGNTRRQLYDVLTGLYPRISIIGPGGELQRVIDWDHLDGELAVHTWRDLLCTV
jgi:FkbM family methyltransferase